MKFVHPSNILISGPTGCGKTQFVSQIIRNHYIDPFPNHILYLYSEWQQEYDKLTDSVPEIIFQRGFPDKLMENLNPKNRNLLILDDQMSKIGDTKELADLFTKGSHHRNLTIIYIVQNLFDKSKSMRTASLNSQYLVIFKSPRDKTVIQHLANQMFPKKTKFLVDAFQDATEKPYGYLLVDLRQETPEDMRIRSNIFSNQQMVYVPI